jgi:hypothetical protein
LKFIRITYISAKEKNFFRYRDSIPGGGCKFFFSPPRPDRLWSPTQPPIEWVIGALSLRVKQPGREADRSPPSSAEVKNAWSYTSTPQYTFMAWCLVKHKDDFTFFTFIFKFTRITYISARGKKVFRFIV